MFSSSLFLFFSLSRFFPPSVSYLPCLISSHSFSVYLSIYPTPFLSFSFSSSTSAFSVPFRFPLSRFPSSFLSLPYPFSLSFYVLFLSLSLLRFGIERVSKRNANTSIFNETTGGQRKLVDHADVDNRATGANLHTSILTNFSSVRRRFRLPFLPRLIPSLHSSGFMRGSTTVFPGSAGLSRDLAEIRSARSGKICGKYEFA